MDIENQPDYMPERGTINWELEFPDKSGHAGKLQVKADSLLIAAFPGGGIMAHEYGTVILIPYWLRKSVIDMPDGTDRLCLTNKTPDGINCGEIDKEIDMLAEASYEVWPKGEYAEKSEDERSI